MTGDPKTYALAPVLQHEDCARLYDFLQGARGHPVTVACDAVTRPHGLALQMLAAATTAWAADDIRFALQAPSPAFSDATRLLALDHLLFAGGAPA